VGRAFKFEAVLNQRQYREDTARKVFAVAARELGRAQQVLAEMENDRDQCRRDLRRKQEKGGFAMEIILYARYLGRLDVEIKDQQDRVARMAEEKEKKRQELMTTLKDRKVIEKLKARHLADTEKKERDLEQKLLNEAAISRYQRNH